MNSASSAAIPKQRPGAPPDAESPPLPNWVPPETGAAERGATVAGLGSPIDEDAAEANREPALAAVKLDGTATATGRSAGAKDDPSRPGAAACATGASVVTTGAADEVRAGTAGASGREGAARGAVGAAAVAAREAAARGVAAPAADAAGEVELAAVAGRAAVVAVPWDAFPGVAPAPGDRMLIACP